MDNKLIVGVISVLVIVTLLGSVLVPVIDSQTEGEKITNEGAGWLRMEYNSSSPDMMITIDKGADSITVTGDGGDSQTGSDDTLIVASSSSVVWLEDGHIYAMGVDATDGTVKTYEADDHMTVQFLYDRNAVTLDDEQEDKRFTVAEWAYTPKSDGNYGYFESGTEVKKEDNKPLAVFGGFAGMKGYNNIVSYDLPMQYQVSTTESGLINGATWTKAAAAEPLTLTPFDPGSITIQPLDPSVLDPEPDASIMATPSYTDGDWGYNVKNGYAVIVSYSGAGGGTITMPDTVGGYTVKEIGTGSTQDYVFPTTVTGSLVLPSTLTKINAYAFYWCNLTGPIELPSSLIEIGQSAFGKSNFTGELVIPSGVIYIGGSAFVDSKFTSATLPAHQYSSLGNVLFSGSTIEEIIFENGLTKIPTQTCRDCMSLIKPVVIPQSVTTIGDSVFKGCSNVPYLAIASDATPGNSTTFEMTGLTEVLDLSDTIDYNTDRYGIPAAAVVQDYIESFGYISFIEIGSEAPLGGSAATLLVVIPVVIIATMLVAAVGWFIYNRY